ncbi:MULTISPECIES: trypsin-like peptidase domain-containing protein [Nitrincola]|uniref:Putative serine protease HhoA n=1 Tax=Nitrincola nitratireducens TaxID=1229521 RepID=W9UPQ7_9GAMM|nr:MULTISPECIES: trypsin-like peptidase domain-containing protein [Nitrincola]EXJ09084.1 Putative serine protease HhoA precursor [Nitrincola nitratireducens]
MRQISALAHTSFLIRALMILTAHFFMGFSSPTYSVSFDVEETDKKVVRILLIDPNGGAGSGSGVILTQDGYILTNHHVVQFNNEHVQPGRKVHVLQKGIDGHRDFIEGVVKAVDIHSDLALIKIDKRGLSHISISFSAPLKASTVYAFGFPGVADQIIGSMIDDLNDIQPNFIETTLTQGVISRQVSSRMSDNLQERSWYQHSAAIHSGNSGGPLLNNCGELVGINTFGHKDGVAALYFSSTLTYITKFLNDSGVSFTQSTEPCSHAFITQSLNSLPAWLIALIIVLIVLFLITIFFAIKQPKTIIEKVFEPYTEWNRRKNKENNGYSNGGVIIEKPTDQPVWKLFSPIENSILHTFNTLSNDSSWLIGRDSSLVDIRINDSTVSKAHLNLFYCNDCFFIEDINSTNGTRINGTKIEKFCLVRVDENTRIHLGNYELILKRDAE